MTTENHAYYRPWTWRDRLRFRLFPSQICPLPVAPVVWLDVLVVKTTVVLDWRDRLRVLLTGRLVVETRTVTEHTVGDTLTASVAYPVLR